jgi:hypothetical protein
MSPSPSQAKGITMSDQPDASAPAAPAAPNATPFSLAKKPRKSGSRIYLVTNPDDVDDVCLVRAISAAQAIRWYTRPLTATVATQQQIVDGMRRQKEIEDASGS